MFAAWHSANNNVRTDEHPESCLPGGILAPGDGNGTGEHMNDEFIPRLTKIWEELLGIRPIGPDQTYFDLGADSIFAVQLFAQIEQEFRIRLPLASFFDAPTIRELAVVLSQVSSASK